MTKKLLSVMMAATMLFATSCQQDEVLAPNNGEEALVQVNLSTPQIATRAYSDGQTATHLQYAVYDAAGNELTALTKTNETINLTKTVNFKLTTGNEYTLVFWAAAPGAPYKIDFDKKTMTVDYSKNKVVGNDEARDAFINDTTIVVNGNANLDIHLRRPFAQLNIGTSDLEASENAGYKVTATKISVPVYTTLDIISGDVTGEATFTYDWAALPQGEKFPVKGYDYLAMNYLLVDADKEIRDVKFEYTNGSVDKVRTFGSIPVQRNFRTNIYGDLLTNDLLVNVEIKPAYEDENNIDMPNPEVVPDSADLAARLTANDDYIFVVLGEDTKLPITSLGSITAGSGEYKLGGVNTRGIIIDLNGKKLDITTTYWSAIGAVNEDATITIKNGTMTSTGNSAGTWNAWNLRFSNCNYVFENVIFEKEIALDNVGKSAVLKNVKINGTGDKYALWITAEGQEVNIDGLNVVTPGRGIKIDEQYVDSPEKVTLNINNATFETEKKAAIVVKSVAGATINASNLNIDGVKADKVFAVWVDEDAKDYAANVEVNGALVKVEGNNAIMGVASSEDLKAALADAEVAEILLAENAIIEGTFTVNRDVTIKSADAANKATIKGRVQIVNSNVTYENIKFDRNETESAAAWNESVSTKWLKNNLSVVMIYGDSGNTINFEGCDFYNIKGSDKSAITNITCHLNINNCYFEGTSNAIYSQHNVSVTNSTFNFTGTSNVILSLTANKEGSYVIFKDNTITNKIYALGQFLTTVTYGSEAYHFDLQDVEGKFDKLFANSGHVTNKIFAEGSVEF